MPTDQPRLHTRIAIIGSGFGGLGLGIRLRQQGIEDFVILERAADVGGTWRDNSYPGCACDVESHLYSFSFELNPEWSHAFARQPEIQEYLRRCADRYRMRPHIRFRHDVRSATWDASAQRWRIETSFGSLEASVLVMASGPLSDPVIPRFPGLESFEGPRFHSAQWRHDVELTGLRVAVIGTGASAIQFVPRIQPAVAHLHLFQRTPPWILPRPDRAYGARLHRLLRRVPFAMKSLRAALYVRHELFFLAFRNLRVARIVESFARRHLRRAVSDPELRRKLTPDYTIFCKRILLSNDYLPAIAQPNVELITDTIAAIRPRSIVTADGAEREVDAIIFGTGFRATAPPLAEHIRGRDGRTLTDVWKGSPTAHLGVSMTGFPNFFMLLGPNSGLGHSSVVYMAEAQIDHVLGALRHMQRHELASVEPREEVQRAYVAKVDRRMMGSVWTAGGCRSWYIDATGRNSTLWPDFTRRYRRRVARFDAAEYVTRTDHGESSPMPVMPHHDEARTA